MLPVSSYANGSKWARYKAATSNNNKGGTAMCQKVVFLGVFGLDRGFHVGHTHRVFGRLHITIEKLFLSGSMPNIPGTAILHKKVIMGDCAGVCLCFGYAFV
jgi:hypothetical protein